MKKYYDSYHRSHMIGEVVSSFNELNSNQAMVSIAGRVVLRRKMGKIIFFNIVDESGNIQVFAGANDLGVDNFLSFSENIGIGDIVGLTGTLFLTRTEEKTIKCQSLTILTPSLQVWPEKFHGLNDIEKRYRQRYLDLIVNSEVRSTFNKRAMVLRLIREHLESNRFMEVETPMFQKSPCGASANPFITHHDAKNIDLYLRISPETFLKQLVVGGIDRVYEIGKNFRNEGVDASHLQEFTMLEWYASYWNYLKNIEFSQEMLKSIILKVNGSLKIEYQGIMLDFSKWQTVDYCELVLADCGIDVLAFNNSQDLKREIMLRNINLGEIEPNISLGNLIDKLYKKVSRPKLIQPTILIHHPAILIPLARLNDNNSFVVDSFQIIVNGWEIAKGYSELNDAVLQRKLLEEQNQSRKDGDNEAMFLDEDFLLALEYAMPPVSGVGVGIDRFVAIVTNHSNLNDIILFPFMK